MSLKNRDRFKHKNFRFEPNLIQHLYKIVPLSCLLHCMCFSLPPSWYPLPLLCISPLPLLFSFLVPCINKRPESKVFSLEWIYPSSSVEISKSKNNFESEKNNGSEKSYGSKEMCVQKRYWAQKKICVQKQFWAKRG